MVKDHGVMPDLYPACEKGFLLFGVRVHTPSSRTLEALEGRATALGLLVETHSLVKELDRASLRYLHDLGWRGRTSRLDARASFAHGETSSAYLHRTSQN
jgi:hypothetical protein